MSVLREAMWAADEALRVRAGGGIKAEHGRMVEGIRAASKALQNGYSARWAEEDMRELRRVYEDAKRERDIAEKAFDEKQRLVMRAWYDLRDAMDAETAE